MTIAAALLLTIAPPAPQAQGAEAIMPTTDRRSAVVSRSEVKQILEAVPQPAPVPVSHTPPAGVLACIRGIESSGDYTAVNPAGYFGAYQFDTQTWNGVAPRIAPEWVGVRPDHAPPAVQDALAWQLYLERGLQPWPTPAVRCA